MRFKKGDKIRLGARHSLESREKMSITKKGSIPWNKGKKMSNEFKNKVRMAKIKNPTRYWLNKKRSKETCLAISKSQKGVRESKETRKKMREAQLKRVRDGKHNNYKGGITPKMEKIRKSLKYRLWREAVFERDEWMCLWCFSRSGNGKAVRLEADHIKPFALYPKLRFDLSNGRTLCAPCHRKTDTFAGGIKKYKAKIESED